MQLRVNRLPFSRRIQARIPFTPLGSHVLSIVQGARFISNTVPFSVTPSRKIGKD